jgi:methionyl-tRNA formyltransferase
LSDLDGLELEWGVVVAYGALIPGALLERVPMLNVHFSLLPRWRGAAPVERAILAGDEQTGVSVMSLEVALDTGPVHLERRVHINDKTFAQLLDELALLGADALVQVLASSVLLANPTPQVGEATYAKKLTKETFHLSPAMTCALLLRTVRLGRAFTFVGARRLLVERAALAPHDVVHAGALALREGRVVLGASDGAIEVQRVRPEGSNTMDAGSWWSRAKVDEQTAEWQ